MSMPFAVGLGIVTATGENARIQVRHNGNKPVVVEIITVDKNLKEIPSKAFPERVVAVKGIRRNGFVEYSPEAYAICAKTVQPVRELAKTDARNTIEYRSCTALSAARGGKRFGNTGGTVDDLDYRLRQALQNTQTTIEVK